MITHCFFFFLHSYNFLNTFSNSRCFDPNWSSNQQSKTREKVLYSWHILGLLGQTWLELGWICKSRWVSTDPKGCPPGPQWQKRISPPIMVSTTFTVTSSSPQASVSFHPRGWFSHVFIGAWCNLASFFTLVPALVVRLIVFKRAVMHHQSSACFCYMFV